MWDDLSPWWKEKKRDRLEKRFGKLVQGVRERHDKLVKKGCTFEKINQKPGTSEHFINHGHICKAVNAYIKGNIYYEPFFQ